MEQSNHVGVSVTNEVRTMPNSKKVSFALLAAALTMVVPTATGASPKAANGTIGPRQIIARARAHLTSRGVAWAKSEAARLRSRQIEPDEVEKDAASVNDGIISGADPDELVLIALIDARNARQGSLETGTGGTGDAKLEQSIGIVLQTLTDTQRPGTPRKH